MWGFGLRRPGPFRLRVSTWVRGMGEDKGEPAFGLLPRGWPFVEAGVKGSVGVVDPVCYFSLPGC